MASPSLSIVIPTYRRESLRQSLASVISQTESADEIIVVDDASPTDLAERICTEFVGVRYLRQEVNAGPGPARQAGILASKNPWVILFDDDDELLPDALSIVRQTVNSHILTTSPTVMFPTRREYISTEFTVLDVANLLSGAVLRGDATAVIQREQYLAAKLEFPTIRVGGEDLLWARIARDYGLPVFNHQLVYVCDRGGERLTNSRNQIKRAAEYAALQERILEEQGADLARMHPAGLITRHRGAAIYWILAGDGSRARPHFEFLRNGGDWLGAAALQIVGWLPRQIAIASFLAYRYLQRQAHLIKLANHSAIS